jgi:hypothetical protein
MKSFKQFTAIFEDSDEANKNNYKIVFGSEEYLHPVSKSTCGEPIKISVADKVETKIRVTFPPLTSHKSPSTTSMQDGYKDYIKHFAFKENETYYIKIINESGFEVSIKDKPH